jgi:hypothetical protein
MMPTLEQMGYVEIQGAIPGDGFCCGWCMYADYARCELSDSFDIHELRGLCNEWKKAEEA